MRKQAWLAKIILTSLAYTQLILYPIFQAKDNLWKRKVLTSQNTLNLWVPKVVFCISHRKQFKKSYTIFRNVNDY